MKKYFSLFTKFTIAIVLSCISYDAEAQRLSAGGYFSLVKCGPCDNVFSYGANWEGELGDSTLINRFKAGVVHNLNGVTEIAAGGYHSLALRSNGTVWAWGANWDGYIGDGTYINRLEPVKTLSLTSVVAVAAGEYHSMALKSDGTVWAWGWNGDGELGDSTTNLSNAPVQVKNLSGVIAISAGSRFSMALKSDGTVWTWGANEYGQLGDSTITNRWYPVMVKALSGVTKISAGYDFASALKGDGTVWTWGYNGNGELGDGTFTNKIYRTQVTGMGTTAIDIDAGWYHMMAIKNDNTVWAWGANWYGNLGDNTNTDAGSPVQTLGGMTGVSRISAGQYHSMAMKSDGSVWGWGYNYEGQLGLGDSNNDYLLPQRTKYLCPASDKDLDIDLSASCTQYDTVPIGATDTKLFVVHNWGCDTLQITNVTSTNGNFTVDSYPVLIAPLDSGLIGITFDPAAPGTYSTTITVTETTSTEDTAFCAWGVGIPPPVLVLNPSSFNLSIPCGTSLTDTLLLVNSGNSNLYTHIYGQISLNSTSNIPINFSDETINHVFTGINSFTNTLTVTITLNGDYNSGSEYTELYIDGTPFGIVPDTTSSYVDVTRVYVFSGAQVISWLSDGIVTVQLDNSSSVGSGGYQIVNLSFSAGIPYYISLAPIQDTAAPTDTSFAVFTVNTTSLSAGTYFDTLFVASNDPSNPLATVPLTINVVGFPEIDIPLSGPCPKFDTLFVGDSYQDTFIVDNLGCDTLFITNVTSSLSHFVVNSFPVKISPYESDTILLSFSPTVVGSHTTTITVLNNDSDESTLNLCLQGVALPAPTFSVNPTSLNVTLGCNATTTVSLTVANPGGSALTLNPIIPGFADLGPIFKYGYIGNTGSSSVSVLNTTTNSVGPNIAVGSFPWRSAIRPDSKFLYVSNRNSNTVSVINTTTNLVVATIPFGGQPSGIGITPDSKFAFVGDRTNQNVKKIDCNTNTIVATITNPNLVEPQEIAVTPNGTRAFVCTQNSGITVIDVATNAVVGNIPGSNGAHSICFTPDGSKAYISEAFNNTVRVVTTSTIATQTVLTGFSQPHGIDISPNGSYVYLLDISSSNVFKIAVSTNSVVATLADPRFNTGWDLVLSPNGKYAYVSQANPGIATEDVLVIDLATFSVTGTLNTSANNARGMATLKRVFAPLNTVSPSTATVTPSGSQVINVGFNSTGLLAGTYTTNIQFYTNDPTTPVALVPTTLTVNGTADFNFLSLNPSITTALSAPPPSLDLDSIMTSTVSTATISISNLGCDSLRLVGATFSNPVFSLASADLPMGPGENGKIVVRFSPLTAGTYTGTVALNTNETDTTFTLYGEAFPQPIQSHIANGYTVTLGCNDTIVDTLLVLNTGGSDLTFQLEGGGGNKLNVLLLPAESGVANRTDVQSKLMSTGRFNVVDIFDAYSSTPTLAQLQAYDAVLTWSNNSYADPTLLGDRLADYADWGGGVVTAMFTNGGSSVIQGRFNTSNYWCINPSGSYTSGGSPTLGTIYFPGHSILNNVVSLNGGTSAYRPLSIMAGATRIADWSDGRPLVVTKDINGSHRVDLGLFPPSSTVGGSSWWNAATDGAMLMANALHYSKNGGVDWLTITPDADTVAPPAPLDTSFVELQFVSSNLIIGTYTTSIVLNSNDPANPSDTIPVTLNVVGAPAVNIFLLDSTSSSCLDLDSIMEFTTSTDTIALFNTGCDTLFIDSLKFTPAGVFSASYIAPFILPGDTNGVVVQFGPVATGTFTATVKIFTNDPALDPVVCLYGEAFARPIQAHVPGSFNITLACNDTLLDTLVIYNTGGSPLIYELEGGGSSKINVAILAAENNAGYKTDVQTKLMGTGKFNLVDIISVNTVTPSLAQLLTYDAVLVFSNTGFANSVLLGNNLADYVDAGGGVVTATFANASVSFSGRFNTDNYWCIVPSGQSNPNVTLGTVFVPTHPVMQGVTNVYGTGVYMQSTTSVHPSATRVANWSNGTALVATRKIGGTNRVDLGMFPPSSSVIGGGWNASSNGALLMANALRYSSGLVSWMSLSQSADTVLPPPALLDSSIVSVQFVSTNLIAGGTYTTSILINSNDPLNQYDTIPVTLNVVGAPVANFFLADSLTGCLDLDSIMEQTISKDTIAIFNTGCDTLFINSLTYAPATVFTTSSSPAYVLPNDTNFVVVQFAPLSQGTYTATLTINTNDLDPVICLKGKAFVKPQQCHNPNTFYEHFLVCQDTLLDTLAICNTGLGTLNYNLWSPYGRSLKLDGSGDYIYKATTTLPTGSIMTVEAWFYPVSYPTATYNPIISFGATNNTNYMGMFVQNNGRPGMTNWSNTFNAGSGATATLNQWNHIACVMNGTAVTLYMNGQPVSGTLPSVPNVLTGNMYIGYSSWSGTYFNGKIDEVRVFNKAKTQAEIQASMRNSLTGTESGLMGYWPFDDSTAIDKSPNTNDGALFGNANITVPNVSFLPAATGTVSASGTYSVQVVFKKIGLPVGTTIMPIFLNSDDPQNAVDTVIATIDVDAAPPTPTASSNSPICAGNDLSLTASLIVGATYSWTGPNSFTSTQQNPVITGASTAATGTYSVTATLAGCPQGAAGTTTVVVNAAPSTPVAGSPATLCSGLTLTLTATTISGATYSWTGPNNFSSTLQNPSIPGATTLASGNYSVTATVPGCPATTAGTTSVTVFQTPGAPLAGSNSPVCAGNDLSLTASTLSGVTYAWTGPNSFTNATQNPVIIAATTAAGGTYTVTAAQFGCTGPKGTTAVVVNPAPGAPVAGSNSTVCSGTTLSLTASTISSATYAWTGPNSFTSSLQNPTIGAATTNAAGSYSVTATVPGCPTSPTGTTTVAVNPTPVAPIASSNSPVCVGNDLSLTASTLAGVTYSWTGPAGFTSSLQYPVITPAATNNSGTYSVSATAGGCTGPKGTTSLTVNPAPGAPVVTSNSTVCSGQTLTLFANTISGASYSWTGPASFTASVQNPTLPGVATSNAGTYSVTATVGGCPTSPVGTGTVVINQSPSAPSPVTSNSPVCSGQTLSLTAGTVSGATYSWNGPLSFTSTLQDPTIATAGTNRAGTYSVTATVGGCPSPAATVSVTIYQTPSAPSISSNSPICAGFTLNLAAPTIAGATYAWTGPNSFTSTLEDPSIPGVSSADAGSYSVTVTVNGCTGAAGTTSVVVNSSPSSPSASWTSPVCSGQTLSLTATTVAGAAYSWSGPNGFTSTLQNPNIVSVTTAASGTYSVSAVVGGCPPSAPGTTSVTIFQTPAAPVAASNTPVCVGTTLSLTANTISGASYNWTGPNSFTAATQNPTIGSVGTVNAGTYTVNATTNGCTGPNSTTNVVVNLPPSVPVAGNGSTICSGQNLSLTASTVAGATYSWTGPNGFASTLQNPSIIAAPSAASGTYSVTATTAGCPPSAPGTTNETVNQTPAAPTASANSPICVGFMLSLNASSTGTTYSWTGPASFSSTAQNPTLASVTTANAGTYSVSATTLGCTGPKGTTTVVVNTIPAAPTAANQSGCFGGTIPALTATGTNIQWYDNTPALVGSGSPFNTGMTAAGTYTYTATQTVNGCTSPSATVVLTINALPATPNAGSDVTICYGVATPTFTSTGSNVTWYNGVGTQVGTGNSYVPGVTAPGSYTFVATQTNTVTTCESLGDTVVFTINSIAPPVAPDVAVCFGNPTPPLVATGTAIQWFDVNNVLVSTANSYSTGITAVGTYTFYVTQTNTVTTCSSPKDTVYLIISTPATVAPNAADAAACFGTTIPNLSASGGTLINWYSDAALTNQVFTGNLYNTGLTATGSYTFFATDSTPGCPEGPSDPAVLTIHSLPATLTVDDTASCFGSTTPLLITSGNNIQWYNNLMAVVSTNDTFATGQTAVGTYTYYVTQTNTVTTCESLKDTVHLTIHALPAKPLALDTAVCSAATIPNLTSTGTNVQWYNSAGTFVFTGNSYATGQTAAGTYTYYVTQKDVVTGCESLKDTSILTIMLSPPVPVANNVAVCAGNPIPALTSSGTNVKWYNSSTLTTLVNTGNTYNTGLTAVGVYTFWVTDSLTGCVSSSADSVSLIINATPAKPTANNVTLCYGSTATLTATGANPYWHTDATLINVVGTGSPFNTGLTAVGSYTYYVTDFAAGCGNSPSDTVLLTIHPTPLVTANAYTITIVQGDSTVLTAYNAVSYAWSPATGLSSTTGPSVVAQPTVTTTYTVTGTNSYGCTNSVGILVIVNPLSVNQLNGPVQDVNIYPNPAIGSFTLEFNTALETPISIYLLNTLGEKVRVMKTDDVQGGGLMKHTYRIDTGTLTEGVYNVEIVTSSGTVTRRVVLFR